MLSIENVHEYIDERFDRVKEDIENRNLEKYLREYAKKFKYICVFGAGDLGKSISITLERMGIHVDYICDNNYAAICHSYKLRPRLISFEELCEIKKETLVFVSVSNKMVRYNDEINKQLQEHGFENVIKSSVWWTMFRLARDVVNMRKDFFSSRIEKLIHLGEDLYSKQMVVAFVEYLLKDYKELNYPNVLDSFYLPNQYFPDFIPLTSEESFVDAGAYVGDTYKDFKEATGGRFEHYYGFEMDKHNYLRLESMVQKETEYPENIDIYPFGVYSKAGYSSARENADASRVCVGEDADMQVELVTLDTILDEKRISYVKMDVEDSEVPALLGAKRMIAAQKPKLAISMYHSLAQFLEIPVLIKEMNPNYTIRYRMHTTVGHDIVCYAINNGNE